MIFKKILTFQEALNIANELEQQYEDYNEKNILLANGFSISCCKDIFTYKRLFEYADFSDEIKMVFDIFDTFDFEKIIKKLNDTSKIVHIYNKDNFICEQLKIDADKIKDELVNVISRKHPEHQHKISDDKYCSAYKFLSNFDKIYTLNYDMLLYWTLMLEVRNKGLLDFLKIEIFDLKDGFLSDDYGNLCWSDGNKCKVFYLHGALHLFDDGIDIIKARTTLDDNLMDVIKTELNNNNYPLIVTEGTSKEKLKKISHNKYLQNAFEKLESITGNLFIHGHSLDNSDEHITNVINKNKQLKQIFISVFEPETNFTNMQEKAKTMFVDDEQHSKKIYFYDAETANVWNSLDKENIDTYMIEDFKRQNP